MLENLIMSVVATTVHGIVTVVASKATKGTKVSTNPIGDSTKTLLRVLEIQQSKE